MIHKLGNTKKHNSDDFIYPRYKDNCISNIPGTLLDLFDVKSQLPKLPIEIEAKSKVVLIILDGFGHNQFLSYRNDHKFLAELTEKSQIYPLTSIFPSQTTNALTTLNTGLAPQQHGLFEYFLYLKEADAIINTLTFEEMGATHRNTLTDKGLHPKMLFDGTTIHEALIESGVKTFTHILTSYAFSHCARQLFDGSTIVPSLRSSDLIVTLRKNLEQQAGPAYFFVHLSNLDTLAHQYGPRSYEYNTELSVISGLLQRELVEKIDPKTAKETLLLVTADHGGVTVDPKKTVHLNNFSELLANMKYGKDGTQVLCTGSPRDVFLHVQEDKVSETKELLTRKVGSRAKVFEIKEALSAGLFGQGEVSSKFLERAGDLLIIPCRSETVWFEHFLDRQFNPLGQHGGLHEDEMVVPLSVAPLSDLK